MSAIPKTFISEQEYLELERKAERKSEYYKGRNKKQATLKG